GPNKFGNYYAGVLPNGRKVTPAGISIQIGMNPLGMAVTPDGQFLVTSNDDEREGGFTSYQSLTNVGGYSLTVVNTSNFSLVSQLHTSQRFFVLPTRSTRACSAAFPRAGIPPLSPSALMETLFTLPTPRVSARI
ncbi:MAG: hypothetical protein LAO56_21625, partial [Acidobacteriia bacterium]|nr:hypothetical protein [Terriglobia bacterium]